MVEFDMTSVNASKKNTGRRSILAVGHYRLGFLLLFSRGENRTTQLYITTSRDGEQFTSQSKKISIFLTGGKEEDISKCSDFTFVSDGLSVALTYLRSTPKGQSRIYAVTKDKKIWHVTTFPKTKHFLIHIPQFHFFESAHAHIIGEAALKNEIAVFYAAETRFDIVRDVSLRDEKIGEERLIKVAVALFTKGKTTSLSWKTELPIIEFSINSFEGFRVLGIMTGKNSENFRMYAATGDHVGFIEFNQSIVHDHRHRKQVELEKHKANPILSPTHYHWEMEGAFNPTAVMIGDDVHLLYRAVGTDGLSRIGHVVSSDGISIDERSAEPIYALERKFTHPEEKKALNESLFHSGGSWGGCEDPKVTKIGDRIYMTYVAHNGYWPTRTALTSISEKDFLNKQWNWTKPMLMSAPNVGSKSVIILPEQIGNMFVIFHRHWPNIVIDLVPELRFGEGIRFLKGEPIIAPRRSHWDSQKLSMGAAPVKTRHGWLAIYNAVDKRDSSRYKIGAMLLDLKDPTKVVSRSRMPILTPDRWYENEGKAGIAYPGGAIEKEGVLHVYYGGGDKVGCVATIPTEELVYHLLKDTTPAPHFSKVTIK